MQNDINSEDIKDFMTCFFSIRIEVGDGTRFD